MPNSNDLYTSNPSQIVMYAVDWCPDCRRARLFLKHKGISYLEVNVDRDKKADSFVRKVNNGNRSVPTIVFPDGTIMVEPSSAELNARFM